MKRTSSLCIALLASGLLAAAPTDREVQVTTETARLRQDLQVVEGVVSRLQAERGALGLNTRHAFAPKNVVRTSDDRLVHRLSHQFQGLRVWGSESIVTTDLFGNAKGRAEHFLRLAGDVDVEPQVTASEAISRAMGPVLPAVEGASRRSFVERPQAELLLYPILKQVRVAGAELKAEAELVATDLQDVVERYALAYYVQSREQSERQSLIATDSIIDAKTGEVLAQWDALQHAAAKATAKTLYNGDRQIDVNYSGTTYTLTDPTRATTTPFNVTPNSGGSVYSSTTAVFGNNTTSDTKTAAASALWAVQAGYDMLKNCYSWTGRDNRNTGVNIKVHLNEDNAYFDGNQTLTFGDGVSMFKPLVSIDVAAHEFGHAVCASTANLTYSGESGGLNESNSDILGTLAEFYALGGQSGSTVPLSGGDWVLGQEISKNGSPLRWMYKPSKDGSSPDIWSSTLKNLDVHYSSGPNNRMFYFLSQGSTASGDYSSSKLTYGPITGIGIHKAGQIWMRALTSKLSASSNYAATFTACKTAATELFGATSVEVNTVTRAFAAIAVTTDVQPIGSQALAITTQPASKTVNVGGSVTFTVAASGGTAPYKYQWYKNNAVVSGATSASYTFTAAAADNGATYYVQVSDSATTPASLKSSTATLTVNTSSTLAISTNPQSQTVQAGASASFTVAATGGTAPYKYQWYKNNAAVSGATSATYSFTAQAADNGATLYAKVTDSAATPTSVTSTSATLTVPGTGTDLVKNGGFEAGVTSWSGSTGVIGNWSTNVPAQTAYEGVNCAYLGGNGKTATETLYQTVAIPASATSAVLSFYLHIDTAESGSTVYDKLSVQVRNSAGTLLKTLATYSNANAASGYQLRSFDLSAYKGQTVRVHFNMVEDASLQTSFVVDKVALK